MAHLESDRGRSPAEFAYWPVEEKAPPRRVGNNTWISLGIAIFLLGGWELGVKAGVISALFFPPPSVILSWTWSQLWSGELWQNLAPSLVRLCWGLFWGGGLGLVFGLLMGWSKTIQEIIEPFISAAHPLPKIALLPLVMVIFGVGNASLVVVSAMGAFFPMVINAMAGVMQIPPTYFEVASNYKASRWKTLTRVVVPASLPGVLTGLRLSANTSLLMVVAAEMVMAEKGLGAMIWRAWNTMQTEEIYSSLLLITILGILLSLGLQTLTRLLVPWMEERK